MRFIHAIAMAVSVPGRTCKTYSARVPSQVMRGSTMMIFVPKRCIISTMECPNIPSGFDLSGSLPHKTMTPGATKRGSS